MQQLINNFCLLFCQHSVTKFCKQCLLIDHSETHISTRNFRKKVYEETFLYLTRKFDFLTSTLTFISWENTFCSNNKKYAITSSCDTFWEYAALFVNRSVLRYKFPECHVQSEWQIFNFLLCHAITTRLETLIPL